MENLYKQQTDNVFSPITVIEEAARCLLCEDAPCSAACPAQTNPARFIRALRFRNIKGAAEIIRENNILGSICARVCPTEKYCQKGCNRCGIDKPIEIGKLQRYITDYEAATGFKALKAVEPVNGKVAVIGSGPAGLAAAAELAKNAYEVTVFEKQDKLGGWLAYGIPEYRLSYEVIDKEISYIKDLGVKFVTNREIKSLDELNDFKAVLMATGFSAGATLPAFENNDKVEIAADFLSRIKVCGGETAIEDNILVVGGGDVAMDVAVTCKKLGAKNIKVVARESFDIFPASKNELNEARALNISVIDGFTPAEVNGDTVVFSSTVDESSLTVKANKIILAIGQRNDIDLAALNLKLTDRGLIATDNYSTNINGVFAAGDIIDGEKSVVYAVKTGKEAANAIIEYLGGK